MLAAALGVLAVATWWLARARGADAELRTRLTRICLLMAAQGVVGISGVFMLFFFVYPSPLISAAAAAAKSLF